MDAVVIFGFGLLASAAVCGGLGAYVAITKERSAAEGAMFGGLLGPVGVLIVAMLPNGQPKTAPAHNAALEAARSAYRAGSAPAFSRLDNEEEERACRYLDGIKGEPAGLNAIRDLGADGDASRSLRKPD